MEEQIDLKEILISLYNKKAFIIIITIIFALAGFIKFGILDKLNSPVIEKTESNLDTVYFAQSTFVVGTTQTMNMEINENSKNLPINITETTRLNTNNSFVETYSEIIKSQSVLNKIITNLNLDITSFDLYNSIAVSRVMNSDLISVIVCYPDEQKVIQISNILMDDFLNNMSKIYFVDQVSVIDNAYLLSNSDIANIYKENLITILSTDTRTFNEILMNIPVTKLLSREQVENIFSNYILCDSKIQSSSVYSKIVDYFATPSFDTKSSIKHIVLTTLIGFITSSGIIFVIDFFDQTIKNENYISSNVLATIKDDNIDNFNMLNVKLAENKSIVLTSSENNDNKDYVVNNLAIAFANANKKTLLLDFTSNESELLSSNSKKGIFDYLKDNQIQNIKRVPKKSNIDNLDIILQGNAVTLINKDKLESIISDLESKYDYIIINTNNILEDANSLIITKIIKSAILIATQRKTKISNYDQAKQNIQEANGNLLGTILIK